MTDNNFPKDLLTLQQDSSGAISAPTNWAHKPLLDIETELTERIEEYSDRLVKIADDNEDKRGVWWFLVGSPGNGKSAVIGSLYRHFKVKGAEFFVDDPNSGNKPQALADLDILDIPYKLELRVSGAQYATAWFVQDASVVTDPYSSSVDPASDLIKLMREAEERGVSLVVCINRGVLEAAFHQASVDKPNRTTNWYAMLKAVCDYEEKKDRTFELKVSKPNKAVFKQTTIAVDQLDHESLLEKGYFKKLVHEATKDSNWTDCTECSAQKYCPFNLNRKWLVIDENLDRLIQSLSYAEKISGQLIVFREAVALISLLLAGYKRDYEKENGDPCTWVDARFQDGDFFTLIGRRIYMTLFAAESPYGFDKFEKDRGEQIKDVQKLAKDAKDETKKAVKPVKKLNGLKTDVGLTRLLGQVGIMSKLDPMKENQGAKLEQRWNIDTNGDYPRENSFITPLEEKCFAIWNDLENQVEGLPVEDSIKAYRSMRRWITGVTYRLGFLSEGKLLFESNLKTFIEENNDASDRDKKVALRRIGKCLEKVLELSTGLPLSDTVKIKGRFIENPEVKVKPSTTKANELEAKIMVGEKTIHVPILPAVYVWLDRQNTSGLAAESFPPDVRLAIDDIRQRIGSGGAYAFEVSKTVQVEVELKDRTRWCLTRDEDLVEIKRSDLSELDR